MRKIIIVVPYSGDNFTVVLPEGVKNVEKYLNEKGIEFVGYEEIK